MRSVLTTDSAHVSRWKNHDVTGIYRGPASRDIADIVGDASADYMSGPLINPRARMALASATLAVLQHASEYDTVIGEDTSGRYPALVVSKAINSVRADVGLAPVRQLFVNGRINPEHSGLKWSLQPDESTLIVTEYVAAGGSTKAVYDVVASQSAIVPDFVVLGGDPEFCAQRDKDEDVRQRSRVYTGDPTCFTDSSDVYFAVGGTAYWKGVSKQSGDAHSARMLPNHQINVAGSRREAALFASVLANYYLDVTRDAS